MILSSRLLPIPGRTIIEDITVRDGAPDDHSYTPYNGIKSHLLKLHPIITELGLSKVIADCRDFDPHRKKPTDDVNREDYAVDITSYDTRIEDINSEFINTYIEQVIYGERINDRGVYRVAGPHVKVNHTMSDEDGEYTSLSEFITIGGDDIEGIGYFQNKLPYILKVLNKYSYELKTNIFSLVQALYKELVRNPSVRASAIKPASLVRWGIYRKNSSAAFGTAYVDADNTAINLRNAISFIKGTFTRFDAVYILAKEMIAAFYLLGISLCDEDFNKYDDDFINSLKSHYIPSNREIMHLTTYTSKQLEDPSLASYVYDTMLQSPVSLTKIDVHSNAIRLFLDTYDYTIQYQVCSDWRVILKAVVDKFDIADYTTNDDGIVITKQGECVIVNLAKIHVRLKYYNVVLTENGFAIDIGGEY